MATSGLVCVKDLGKAGIDYFEITGATKKEDRIELVNRFNDGENSVFLISLKAEEILSGETNIISKMTESDFMELLG